MIVIYLAFALIGAGIDGALGAGIGLLLAMVVGAWISE